MVVVFVVVEVVVETGWVVAVEGVEEVVAVGWVEALVEVEEVVGEVLAGVVLEGCTLGCIVLLVLVG